ncbi:toxin-antitoxin system YwqK family antitoxin [Stigmatella aurantiaca]|uniref:MORN repeat variant n=1 Tax=Stigmatella aurantiaca (strain DW4/3-1) TaxID=378806 RepID=E3FUV6_STIAD|nr:hypothetical protein [Stigmatella aurantiaca]ADO68394.1 uncharacterized protein STAUR_0590 [Stigmatella aurantiaca DW4/3-1]
MKLFPRTLTTLAATLLAVSPALAMDKRQADAVCASWTLACPPGATASGGPKDPSGTLECRMTKKGRQVRHGPSVTCADGEGQSWGNYKDGKKQGRHVALNSDGSWSEEDFVDNRLEGRSVEYDAKGQLLSETYFQAGKRHGPSRTYARGVLTSEEAWEKGRKVKKPTAKTRSQAP